MKFARVARFFGANSVTSIYIMKCISGSNPGGSENYSQFWNYVEGFVTNSTEIRRFKGKCWKY
jgi:hypothetical protein